jgi:fumarate hydratase subunit beta
MTPQAIRDLRAGDEVLLTGAVLTGRDRACARLYETIQHGDPLPIRLTDQLLYFVGPSPAPPGRIIGAAGPTTSGRMDPFLPTLLGFGLQGFIGKGYLSRPVKDALIRHSAVYFGAIGGTGALLSSAIREVEVLAFEDLQTEAIWRMRIESFPVVVLHDVHGGDLYDRTK